MIRACVRDHVAHIAGLSPHYAEHQSIDDHLFLSDYGIDSLAAIELKNKIQKSIVRTLPVNPAFAHPTVAAITDYVHGLYTRQTLHPDKGTLVEAGEVAA